MTTSPWTFERWGRGYVIARTLSGYFWALQHHGGWDAEQEKPKVIYATEQEAESVRQSLKNEMAECPCCGAKV